ncbi:DNA primase [bacterium]|nr:DNA primase [bacterium]
MKIPEEKIEEIKQATDIVELISQYVTLKRRGKSYVGLCPFHTEKTPSFTVDPVKGFYHCFGCGAGGNVFTFIMETEKISFPEAVTTLAKKAGIILEFDKEDDQKAKKAEVLYRTNAIAAEFYRDCLFKTNGGKRALDYLAKRDFNEEIILKFGLGYAPLRWDGLILKAKKESIPLEHLFDTGLVTKSKNGERFYDRFRGRIMFPIHSPSGRVVGFGGRIIEKTANEPKYLNSPETIVYRKSKILYGLYHAKEGIRKEDRIIVVEGYTDVMRMFQKGFENTVSSSGTAFTQDQAQIIRRYTLNVTLLYDGDSAGLKAALRGADILLKSDIDVSIVPLPKGSDPDSFLREHGSEAMADKLDKSMTFFDFYLDRLQKEGRLETPKQRSRAVGSLLDKFAPLLEYKERMLLIKDLSDKFGIDEKFFYRKYLYSGNRKDSPVEEDDRRFSLKRTAEEGILKSMLFGSKRVRENIINFLNPDELENDDIKKLFIMVKDRIKDRRKFTPETILDSVSTNSPETALVTGLIIESEKQEEITFQYALDCLLKIKELKRKEKIEIIRQKILDAQSKKKPARDLLREFNTLKNEIQKDKEKIIKIWFPEESGDDVDG